MQRICDFVDEGLGHSSYVIDLGNDAVHETASLSKRRCSYGHSTRVRRRPERSKALVRVHDDVAKVPQVNDLPQGTVRSANQ